MGQPGCEGMAGCFPREGSLVTIQRVCIKIWKAVAVDSLSTILSS